MFELRRDSNISIESFHADKTGTSLPMKLRESTLSIHRALCHVDKD